MSSQLIPLCIIIKLIVSMKLTTISIRPGTYRRLKSYGKMGESFDQLLLRVLDEVENK